MTLAKKDRASPNRSTKRVKRVTKSSEIIKKKSWERLKLHHLTPGSMERMVSYLTFSDAVKIASTSKRLNQTMNDPAFNGLWVMFTNSGFMSKAGLTGLRN